MRSFVKICALFACALVAFVGVQQLARADVNTAPVLDNSKSPVFSSILEDAGAPVGAVGTLVSQLVDFASPAGQVDNVTDPDAGALLGIAITETDASLTCYYTTNGGSVWSSLGTPAANSARLLAANANNRVYCHAVADQNGVYTSAITFRAWDQTSGTDGSVVSTTTNGGTTAFSVATDTASLTITGVEDAPTGYTASYQDVNNDGAVDRLVVVVNGGHALTACTVSAGEISSDWTYSGGGIGGSLASASCDTASATITFTISGATALTTSGTPTIAYDNDDGDNSIANSYGSLGTVGATGAADEAPPYMFRLTDYYGDFNQDGTITDMFIAFSESISCEVESGDWSFSVAGGVGFQAVTGCYSYVGNTYRFTVTSSTTLVTGGTAPQFTYSNQGTLGSLRDAAGNQVVTTGPLTLNDAGAPQIRSFTYQDADVDGKIDRLLLTFTEPITSNSFLSANDLVFNNVGDFTGAAFGTDGTDLVTGTISTLTMVLGTEATAVDTANGNGSISISSRNSFVLRDAAFNIGNTLKVQSQASYIDGAAPVYVSSSTLDNNQNGTVDYVRVTYSEPIDDASVAAADFAAGFTGVSAGALVESVASGTPASGVVTDTANDAAIYVGIASGTDVIAPNKTDYTMHIAQVGSVSDVSGNALASFTEQTSTDGAAPALYTSTVIDSPTTNTAPTIFFSIIEDGTLSYTGGCTMPLTNVVAGAYLQAFDALADGTYSCTILGTDALGNVSAALTINTFTVDTASPLLSAASVGQSTGTTTTITWTTNEPTSSIVNYGTTTAYGSSTGEVDTAPRVTSHSVSISGLVLCRDYHFRPSSKDSAGNEIVGPDIVLSNLGGCGAALPVGALSGPVVPEGGFKISFKEGAVVSAPTVTLLFNAGEDVTQLALSNSADFSQAVLEAYQPVRVWNVCQKSAADVPAPVCKPGTYAVYVKFYTKWGRSSDVVTASVTVQESGFSSHSLVQDGNTIYLILGGKKYGFTSFVAFQGLGYATKRVVRGKTTTVPLGGLIKNASAAHLSGSWVVQNKTVYFIADAGRIPVSSWEVFLGNGGTASVLLPANSADMAKPVLPTMSMKDGRVN